MKIIRYVQNHMTIGLIVPLIVVISLGLLSYFFLNELIKIGKAEDYQDEVILRTEKIISLTRSVQIAFITSEIPDSVKDSHSSRSFSILWTELLYMQSILHSENLDEWLKVNAVQPAPQSASIRIKSLEQLITILNVLKNNQSRILLDLKMKTSKQFRQFVAWFVACLILGILLSLLWARNFWISLNMHKKIESRLRNAVYEINDLYDNSPCGYFSVNADYMIEKVNNTFIDWLGYTRKEIVDCLHISEVFQIKDDWLRQLIEGLQANGSVNDLEVDIKRKDGSLMPGIINVNWQEGVEQSNRVLRFTLYDNTERRKAENQIRNLNKELEAFSYSVSHDLRAPLRSINSYSQILKEDYFETLEKSGALPTVDVIIRNSSKMGHLIDDLLNFSKLSRIQVAKSDVDMNALVNSVREEVLNGNSQLLTFKHNPLLNCKCDVNLIQQVWVNLLSNAVKYSSKKESPCVEVGTADAEKEIIYYVKDNGAGFEMQYAHKLFSVFQRLHKDSEFPGTGVGLALVKRIIERHQGRVWAESQVGVGSTFYFTLPKES